MLSFLVYKTPTKYFSEFDNYYSYINLKQVKVISSIVFILSVLMRICFLAFHEKVQQLAYYEEFSYANLAQLFGSLLFFLASSYLVKSENISKKQRKLLVTIFVLYMLTMTFSVTFILSLHNAKNMLAIFLLGIMLVCLFFALELEVILFASLYIVVIYVVSYYFSPIDFSQKIMNTMAIVILGTTLFAFSRYAYYFRSKHFIRIKQLEEKNREILHLNSQKGEMLSFVAHDLRAPLNNIEALGNLILMEDEHHNEANIIVNATQKAKRIIDDLIEAAKQDRQALSTKILNLNEFINDLLIKWRTNTPREIKLLIGNTELLLSANPVKLERAIDNLISNAIKFSHDNHPIDIRVRKNEDKVVITVSDMGIGIPVNLQSHIFDQFSIAGRRGLQGEKSVGLGLHISQKIIEQHCGTLEMESKENKGTTFTIALPLENT